MNDCTPQDWGAQIITNSGSQVLILAEPISYSPIKFCSLSLLNGEPEGRTTWTTLTPEQNREAIAAFNSLTSDQSTPSLSFAVSFPMENYRSPDLEKSSQEAVNEYLTTRDRDCIKDFITQLQYRAIKNELKRSYSR